VQDVGVVHVHPEFIVREFELVPMLGQGIMKTLRPVRLGGRKNDRGTLRMEYLPRRREVVASLTTWENAPDGRQVGVRHLTVAVTRDVLLAALLDRESEEDRAALEAIAQAESEDEEPVNFILQHSETVH
jgi:hypothetical protein